MHADFETRVSGSKKTPFDPGLIITNQAGVAVAKVAGGLGKDAIANVQVAPGTYTVKVFPADHFKAKDGYRYRLSISGGGTTAGNPVAAR